MIRIQHAVLVIITSALFALSSCAPPEPIRIGFLSGLPGRSPDHGIDGLHGVRLTVELRNKAGGIKGRVIELIEADDQQDPEMVLKALGYLIEHKVLAVVGPKTSAIAVPAVPLAIHWVEHSFSL